MGTKGSRSSPLCANARLRVLGTRITLGSLAVFGLFVTAVVLMGKESEPSLRPSEDYGGESKLHAFVMRTLTALGSKDPLREKVQNLKRLAKEQIIVSNAYAQYARQNKLDMVRQVRLFDEQAKNYTELLERDDIKKLILGSALTQEAVNRFDVEMGPRLENSRELLNKAKEFFDTQVRIQRLRDEVTQVRDQLDKAKKQGAFSSLIAAKSVPKALHCLSMRLMSEHIFHPKRYPRLVPPKPEWEDPDLYHYAIFSDNVLAASVVVNSAVVNAKEPWKHVFHVVTDRMNLGAMIVWFKKRPPKGGAFIEVKAVEDYKFLNASYVPVLKQLEMANLQQFYFESKLENATRDSANLKFRNPKYLSMLNHLRFYLPEMYPTLHKILFLDDDIVVQKDLTELWKVKMDGNVNAAVETCFGSFHRFDKYMNFSHPLVKEHFDPKSCGWAYGMNFFDLDAWREKKCTEDYHFWQSQNVERQLWKLGTLPPGLMTFYKKTKPLDKSWHVLGLGYNPNIDLDKIRNAAVIHFNGNMKPWLDLAMNQYREFWTKYVDYEMEYIQTCNFGH